MALTNTGGSRMQSLTISTLIDGVTSDPVTYWITQDLPSGFKFRYLGNPVTLTYLTTVAEGDFNNPVAGTYADLLDTFISAVESLYDGLDISDGQSNSPYNLTNGSCPITIGKSPEVAVYYRIAENTDYITTEDSNKLTLE